MPRRKLTVLRKPLNTDVTIAARAIRARIHYARPCIQFESFHTFSIIHSNSL